MKIILAACVYYLFGYIIFYLIESKNRRKNLPLFTFTFVVALAACSAYYATWLLLGLENHKGVEGLFSPDSSTYYLDAVALVNANFDRGFLDTVITDHYHEIFLAIQMYIFGEHVLIPKIYQVFVFSIGVVLWVSITRDIFNDKRIVKYFFYLMVFCIPLLTYNAHVLKEISLFLATTIAIYGFTRYHYSHLNKTRYLWVSLLGIVLMFMFRRQFALVMFFSLLMGTFLGSGLKFQRKLLWGIVSLVLFFIVSTLPIFQQIGATAPLTEGGSVFIGRGETGGRVSVGVEAPIGGMFGSAYILLTNPLLAAPMLLYGILQLFFHPPFLYSPNAMISRGDLSYLTMGYYNLLFTMMLPAFYFGAKNLYQKYKGNPVLLAILAYFILASLGTIFGSDSYRRFKISYFWPIAYLYISYGIAIYPVWKQKLPMIILVFIGLLSAFFLFDFIGLVTA